MFTFDQNGPDFIGTFTSPLNGLIHDKSHDIGFHSFQRRALQIDSSLLNVVLRDWATPEIWSSNDPSPIAFTGSHWTGKKWRAGACTLALYCRWPHDRHIAPTCLMSVSFDISFSRTASEPAMTGPVHWSQE